jgi:RNA polymerase sigma factor (sigma-70 family)
MQPGDTRTSATLLARLRQAPADPAAWREFVARYGPLVYRWCRQWQLQDADAEDVTQNVLVGLAERLKEFEYDPAGSFRGWLRVVAHHAWTRWHAGWQRAGRGSGDSRVAYLLESQEARDDFVTRLEQEFDRELFELATQRVRLRVEARTWDAFRLTVLEDCSGAEAARQLAMNVAAVYVAKGRVQKLLREALADLEQGG